MSINSGLDTLGELDFKIRPVLHVGQDETKAGADVA